MAKLVKDSKKRECMMLQITPENSSQLKAFAKENGFDITKRKIGGQKVPCVLIPPKDDTEEELQKIQKLHDIFYKSEDAEQKRRIRAKRPKISNGKGKLIRCPMTIPNPAYEEGKKGVTKTIKNDCMKCKDADTCDWWKSQQESIEGGEENAGDSSEVITEIEKNLNSTLMPNDEKFRNARNEVLCMIDEKYPEYYDAFALLLAGESRNQVVQAEAEKDNGLSKSNIYNLPKGLKADLVDLLDKLWYLDIDTSKYRQ